MYKILVVDDEPEIVKVLEIFFIKKGFEVIAALGGEKAMELFHSGEKIDLMVLDMKMPKVKGIDVLKEMKKLNKRWPVIILSGTIDMEKHKEELEEMDYSLDDIHYKPTDLYKLLDMVNKKLGLNSKIKTKKKGEYGEKNFNC